MIFFNKRVYASASLNKVCKIHSDHFFQGKMYDMLINKLHDEGLIDHALHIIFR
jgi:hypothetical protein